MRFGYAVDRIDERIPGIDLPLMSVSQTRGVIRRSELTDKPHRADSLDIYKVCRRDDIVFNKMSIRSGAMGVAGEDGLVTYHYEVMRPREWVDSRFIAYLMKSNWFTAELIKRERGIGAGGQGNVRTTEVPFSVLKTIDSYIPETDEQRAIADYLDQETAQIDALVAKQEEFIGLLRERRIEEIKSATGWGHQLPDNWTRARLSHLFRTTGSGTTPANEEILDVNAGDVSWVTTGELREQKITDTQRSVSLSTLKKYSALKVYPAGTLLVAMYGATIGRTGLLEIPAATNQACCALVDPIGVIAEFVEYSLIAGRAWLLLDASGGGQPNINQDKVRAFRIPVPPIDEQRAIVERINEQTTRIDALIAKAEEHIALAKERRSALITAAVTGQFDVRTAKKGARV
ncbi:UNVERIFIED_CONTAM: restriction endonuclease subunit S [Actinomycetes bacterium ARC8]|nr:restriction endonuclease subunit S [Actinomycetes bacterium ARC8]